ncbi:MAG TPA: universal stress protein [Xanthomonadaceae bacterium]|nr:universal stress protein [Xanthomonadaceae bacterium]
MKILLAVDGSENSLRAVKQAVRLARELAKPPRLTLFHASAPLLPQAERKLGAEATARYYGEEAELAVGKARAALRRARVAFDERLVAGEPAAAIVEAARGGRYDQIVMGSRGQGALQGLLLGSVASKVLAGCDIPVLVVR